MLAEALPRQVTAVRSKQMQANWSKRIGKTSYSFLRKRLLYRGKNA